MNLIILILDDLIYFYLSKYQRVEFFYNDKHLFNQEFLPVRNKKISFLNFFDACVFTNGLIKI